MDKQNEYILNVVEASMRAEGFTPSASAKQDSIDMLEGKISVDDLVQQYVNKYTQTQISLS